MKAIATVWMLLMSAALGAERFQVTETADHIDVRDGAKPVLRYQKSTQTGPAGTDPAYARSGYIHPVYNPAGQELTGDFPADHAHQHALFLAWTRTNFEGREIDFWNQKARQGRISHAKVLSTASGEESGSFTVELLYEDLTAPGGPKPVLREIWTVTVRPSGDESAFLFEVESQQRCASESPLTILEYHYGGMALRGPMAWLEEEEAVAINKWLKDPKRPMPAHARCDFLTSEGKNWHDGNQTRARWVDLHGVLDGKPAGIAVLSHPGNFRAPMAVRLHPTKPYFCFAPMVDGEFQIRPGEVFRSRYRFVAHTGAPKPEILEAMWKEFSEK